VKLIEYEFLGVGSPKVWLLCIIHVELTAALTQLTSRAMNSANFINNNLKLKLVQASPRTFVFPQKACFAAQLTSASASHLVRSASMLGFPSQFKVSAWFFRPLPSFCL